MKQRFSLASVLTLTAAFAAAMAASRLYGDYKYPHYGSPLLYAGFAAWVLLRAGFRRDLRRVSSAVVLLVIGIAYVPMMMRLDDFFVWLVWDYFGDFSISIERPWRGFYETGSVFLPGIIHAIAVVAGWWIVMSIARGAAIFWQKERSD